MHTWAITLLGLAGLALAGAAYILISAWYISKKIDEDKEIDRTSEKEFD